MMTLPHSSIRPRWVGGRLNDHLYITLVQIFLAPFVAILVGFPIWIIQKATAPQRCLDIARIPATRLGHFLAECDVAVSAETNAKVRRGTRRTLYYLDSSKCISIPVLEQVRHILPLWPSYLGWILDGISRLFNKLSHRDGWHPKVHQRVDLDSLLTEESWLNVDNFGDWAALSSVLGINHSEQFAAVFLRDSEYERHLGLEDGIEDNQHRNTESQSYETLVELLSSEGLRTVFMGAAVPESATTSSNGSVDYTASGFANPENDLTTTSRCEFALACDSGSSFLPIILRKPTALVNMGSLFGLTQGGPIAMVCLKHFVDRQTGHELNFKELVARGLDDLSTYSAIRSAGVEVYDCEPSELAAVGQDMLSFVQILAGHGFRSPHWLEASMQLTVPLDNTNPNAWPRVSRSWAELRPLFLGGEI